jgi:hypothetical protein
VALRELLAVDPTVAQRVPLARLDTCFDDAAFLTHVPEIMARLDRLAARVGERTSLPVGVTADAG